MDKTQTPIRQNRTTHISPDLRKAHSDIAISHKSEPMIVSEFSNRIEAIFSYQTPVEVCSYCFKKIQKYPAK